MKPQTAIRPWIGNYIGSRLLAGRHPHAATLILTLALLAGLVAGVCSPAQADFGYRKAITIKGSMIGGALTNFPALIQFGDITIGAPGDPDLKTTANGGHVQSANGYDMVFRAADGSTALVHEVEYYNSATGHFTAWVNVSSLQAGVDTTIYLYYGDASVTAPTANPAAVWDSSFEAVWHLSNNNFQDSTINDHDGANGVSTDRYGKIACGRTFDRYNSTKNYFNCGPKPGLQPSKMTFSFWLNRQQNETWSGEKTIFWAKESSSKSSKGWYLNSNDSTKGSSALVLSVDGANGFYLNGINANTFFAAWQPVYVAITYDAATGIAQMFKNGVAQGGVTVFGTPQSITSSDTLKYVGNTWGSSFEGYIDEVRLSDVVRPAAWIATEEKNMRDPAAFITIGPEEKVVPRVFYKISSVAGTGGAISPAGDTMVEKGLGQAYTVTVDSGYKLGAVTVDGVAVSLTGSQYSFVNVQANHTIVAGFEPVGSVTPPPLEDVVPGCSPNTAVDYSNSSGFKEPDLNLVYVGVDPVSGWLALNSGTLDPNNINITVPFTQSMAVTMIYNGAGFYGNDFGWMYAKDLPADKNTRPDPAKMYWIYENITPGKDILTNFNKKVANGGNALGLYNNVKNNRVILSQATAANKVNRNKKFVFPAGTELAFWFFQDSLLSWWAPRDDKKYFYTKKDWNEGTLNDVLSNCPSNSGLAWTKNYDLNSGLTAEGTCVQNGAWMSATALSRAKTLFGFDFTGATAQLNMVNNQKYQHALVGQPKNKPNEWIMGWEEASGGRELDHNDLIFHVERQSGGTAQLKNPIVPASTTDYITALDVKVYDYIPACSVGATAPTPIRYYVSVDKGKNWVEITQWDEVWASNASKASLNKLASWTPGSPEYTWRSFRVDFAGLNQTGRELLWKAEFRSASLNCAMPAIMDVQLKSGGVISGNFSRGAPVVKANVIYSGYYQTPANTWLDKSLRGHLTATRLYAPENPNQTAQDHLWDAGEKLTATDPATRKLYFPDVAAGDVETMIIGAGDGEKKTFTGKLTPNPIAATTLIITDGHEKFIDKHTDVLEGDLGGTGAINRFTGEFSLSFSRHPDPGAEITASYRFYEYNKALLPLDDIHATKSVMGLDDTLVATEGYVNDFDKNGAVEDADARYLMNWVRGYQAGTTAKRRDWLLGPIDHSVPALVTPPGLPQWYFGTATTKQERQSFEAFMKANTARKTVLFAGSRGGMLHAFNAGSFRHGDNSATTGITEKRGYFLPDALGAPDYGDGSELWAFIPANLLPRLKNNLLAQLYVERVSDYDQAYIDASPAVADAYFGGAWRTVLLSAEGNGGDTVFCLDITNPESPNFLWEFADPDLFRSRSSPSVGKIGRILVNGAARWVAFFVSGGDQRYDRSQFPSVYMIDVETGSVIKRVFLDCEPLGKGGVPSGQPTVIDSDGNGYIDRFYIGTDKGYLYKVNIPDDPDSPKYPISHCVVNTTFTDVAGATVDSDWHYQPIYGSPVAIVDNTITENGSIDYAVKIFFGTGDSPYYAEDINTAGTRYHFYAYADKAPKGSCDARAVSLDWFYELPEKHRVFNSAFAAAGTIYFGTATANTEDPCEAGGLQSNNQGELFAFDMKRPSDLTKPVQPKWHSVVGNMVASPLVEDQHIYVKAPGQGMLSLGAGIYNNGVLFGGWPEMRVLLWREIW